MSTQQESQGQELMDAEAIQLQAQTAAAANALAQDQAAARVAPPDYLHTL